MIAYAKGSGAGFEAFQRDEADAWITWSYWPIDHPDAADAVPFADDRVIYRDINVVASPKADPETLDFVAYLRSDEAQELFEARGMFR